MQCPQLLRELKVRQKQFLFDVIGSPPSWPKLVRTYSKGILKALIFYHKVSSMVSGDFWCWTFLSVGLQTVGQAETLFTIRRRETEREQDYPGDPLWWFEVMYEYAVQGQVVHEYGDSRFQMDCFLGRADFLRIVYCIPVPIDGISESALPDNRLHAIMLTTREAEIQDRYGIMRVLSSTGFSQRWFPYVFWIDRDRPDFITMAEMQGSFRTHCGDVYSVFGVYVYEENSKFTMYVTREAGPPLQILFRSLTDDDTIVLESFLHPEADACYVWKCGNTLPYVIHKGTSYKRRNVCFLAIGTQPDKCEQKLVEDGCGRT